MNDYNLLYTEDKTGKKYEGKRITANDYKLRDPDTGLTFPISLSRLCKNFTGDKKNKLRKGEAIKQLWSRVAF